LEPSDEQLVLACRSGDAAAWEALVHRYQRLIYSIPRRAGLDAEQAGDVFGHVFAALVEHLHSIEQPARVKAWLVTTAKRETWRVSRSARATAVSLDRQRAGDDADTLAFDIPDDDPLPDVVVERLDAQHTIRMAVDALDERCRGLLTALFLHDTPPPYAEIAATTGVPEGSIGPTRARCLQKLKRHLDGLGW
jgi:RNA polymerase sigma factor (sigma-70 family)